MGRLKGAAMAVFQDGKARYQTEEAKQMRENALNAATGAVSTGITSLSEKIKEKSKNLNDDNFRPT